MNSPSAVLGATQRRVFRLLGPVLTHRGFYLAGGTALALRLSHRRSVDLDWFTPEGLSNPLRLAQDLRDDGIPFTTDLVEAATLHGSVSKVRVSLLEYRYPLLERLISWPAFGCKSAGIADLAAMKLAAVAQRGAKKDFVDIYALGVVHANLAQMLEWYRQKYSLRDIGHVLYSLVYFDDADKERMPEMLWKTNWRTIKQTIKQWVKDQTL